MKEMAEKKQGTYKSSGKRPEDLRRQRADWLTGLRKLRKDKDLAKRRQIVQDVADSQENQEGPQIGPRPDDATIRQKLNSAIQCLYSELNNEVCQGLEIARGMIDSSTHPPLIDEVVESGMVPKCIELLRSSDENIKFEAATIIVNLTSDKIEHLHHIVELDAVTALYDALNSKDKDVVGRVLWAMGNISAGSLPARDRWIQLGIIQKIQKLWSTPLPSAISASQRRKALEMLRCLCWASAQILSLEPRPSPDIVRALIPIICQLFGQDDREMLEFSSTGIQNVIICGEEFIQDIVCNYEYIIPRLLVLLTSEDVEIVKTCANIVWRIISVGTYDTLFLRSGPIPILDIIANLLTRDDLIIVYNSVHIIRFLVLDPNPIEVVGEVHKLDIVPKLLKQLKRDINALQWPIAAALTNIALRSSPEEIMMLYGQGVLVTFCTMLRWQSLDIVREAVDGIEFVLTKAQSLPDGFAKVKHVLEECGGLEKIEILQTCQNERITRSACSIVDKFFPEIHRGDYETTDMDFMEVDTMTGSGTSTSSDNLMATQIPVGISAVRPQSLQLVSSSQPLQEEPLLPSPFVIPGPAQFAFTPGPTDPTTPATRQFNFDEDWN